MVRHLHSLRRMQRDHGWIHTLLEEAENERMHLMTFLQLKKPGPLFRFCVIGTQYVFTCGFFLAYLVSPKFCHRYMFCTTHWQFTSYFNCAHFHPICEITIICIFKVCGIFGRGSSKNIHPYFGRVRCGLETRSL